MSTAPAQEAVTPTIGRTLRRAQFWIVAAIVVAVIAIGGAVLRSATGSGATFAPDNPGPAGAMALRSVLQLQGVQVDVTSTVAGSASTLGTLLVDDTDARISAASWTKLLAGRTRVVILAPDRTALDAALPDVQAAGAPGGSVVPVCRFSRVAPV